MSITRKWNLCHSGYDIVKVIVSIRTSRARRFGSLAASDRRAVSKQTLLNNERGNLLRDHALPVLMAALNLCQHIGGADVELRRGRWTQGVTRPPFHGSYGETYAWLLVAAACGVCAATFDTGGGTWGASRHALTVGFLGTMVFAIGQRVLPVFCGMRLLYGKKLMLASLAILNLGCFFRVAAEIPAYEFNVPAAWTVLPYSAIAELTAVSLFALNLGVTLVLPPPVPAVSI